MQRRGSILIIVLWALFILGALAVAVSGYVHAQIAVAGKLSELSSGRALANALIENAIAGIKTAPANGYDTCDDIWKTSYGLSDEESKINVNRAPREVLKNFFVLAGKIEENEADKIASSVLNWRSPADQSNPDGADTFHYQALDRPYPAKNAPMDALEELLLVDGVKPEIFGKIRSRATIYGNGAVNINTADELVLRSLGMSEDLAKKVIDFRAKKEKEKPGDTKIPAADDKNYFDDASQIAALLTKKESISDEESGKINSLTAAGLLGVSSDNFGGIIVDNTGGRSAGKVMDKPAGSTGGPLSAKVKINFIFDRKNGILRYWSE